jgi:Tfp pilus assembly protein PilE
MIDSPRRRGFGHPDLVATLAVLGILAGMLLPAIQKVREAAAKATCTSNLRLLGLAVHTFHDTMNRLPKSCDYALDGMDTKTAPHATKKIEYPAGSSLYVDMLKYVEQVHQLDAGSKTGARNKLVAVKMDGKRRRRNVPRSGDKDTHCRPSDCSCSAEWASCRHQ